MCSAPSSWLYMMLSAWVSGPAHLAALSCLYFRWKFSLLAVCLYDRLVSTGCRIFSTVLGYGIVLCVGGKTGKGTSSDSYSKCVRILLGLLILDRYLCPDPRQSGPQKNKELSGGLEAYPGAWTSLIEIWENFHMLILVRISESGNTRNHLPACADLL